MSQQPKAQPPGVDQLWIQHQRRNHKTTLCFACIHCLDRKIFMSPEELWHHALKSHQDQLPDNESEHRSYRKSFVEESEQKRRTRDDWPPRKNAYHDSQETQPDSTPKRPFSSPGPVLSRGLSDLKELNIHHTPGGSENVAVQDVSAYSQAPEQPRKRPAVGEGISAGSTSPHRDESPSPSANNIKASSKSAPRPYSSEPESRDKGMFEIPRPHVEKKQLWTPQDATRSRVQAFPQPHKNRKTFQSSPQASSKPQHNTQNTQLNLPTTTVIGRSSIQQVSREEPLDIMLQPETRPISQEQLVAEVKGIYAGLVMVEAKCIEVDNKQAALAQVDCGNPPRLNNEQWQALIALHRTLLHEHHDFFLASQHPSASPALRRLASKYAMPARMWRHGIHSFLELLRHRLPASLDHMLAFIYLAYSMMALLYETVSAFKDTWVECLGDLGRYRMAIEDDDIRDREVWTGVARHWYSIASDNSPTTGRLYHHLAILARPNALQQLFFYTKSICVAVPFTSARESILTLFEPVLNADNGQGQYRLPPLDTAFVKAHGLLFTNKDLHKFDPAVKDFLGLLDTQIGRVTRKFMEQGYHIAVANSVAMVGFASKDNVLMKAILPSEVVEDVTMGDSSVAASQLTSFQNAQRLNTSTIEIVLERVGDPNVLPFIHVTLIFMYFMARHAEAMRLLEAEFPWKPLSIMLNTLLGSFQTPDRVEDDVFPLPEKDDPRPFPEDFATRGLLWTEGYFPDGFFTKKKIDEEEKYHERASMTSQRKERILWLGRRIAALGPWIIYDGSKFSVPSKDHEMTLPSRSSTTGLLSTTGSFDRAGTWESQDGEQSDTEEDLSSPTTMRGAE